MVGHTIHILNGMGLALLFGYVALPISKRIVRLPIWLYAVIFMIVELIVTVWHVTRIRCWNRRTKYCTRSANNDIHTTYSIWFNSRFDDKVLINWNNANELFSED